MEISLGNWDDSTDARRAVAELGRDEVQVWWAEVPPDEAALAMFTDLLSLDERLRAAKFVAPGARREFVFGRACLRQLLRAGLRSAPPKLVLECAPRGKPSLPPTFPADDLRFNLTHSKSLVAIALSRGREVGVDLEWIDPLTEWPPLAERVFSPRELAELHALAAPQQRAAFYQGWTLKEAYFKATGEGLNDAMWMLEVTLAPDQEPEWIALPGGTNPPLQWALRRLPVAAGFAGALVFELP